MVEVKAVMEKGVLEGGEMVARCLGVLSRELFISEIYVPGKYNVF